MTSSVICEISDFYPRPLRGGRPMTPQARPQAAQISIHALCEEGDVARWTGRVGETLFLSTPSARRATTVDGVNLAEELFLSTPSARRATTSDRCQSDVRGISIHALCEEGDRLRDGRKGVSGYFYPRPLRGGRRSFSASISNWRYFYPRPLRGGRQVLHQQPKIDHQISIHALCEEGDAC